MGGPRDGNPLRPDRLTKAFTRLCAEAWVRQVRPHDLRHGAASLRLAAGVDLGVISKLLGHSSIGITADTYSHLLEGVGRAAAEKAMALVRRKGTPPTGGHTWGTPDASEPETIKGSTGQEGQR